MTGIGLLTTCATGFGCVAAIMLIYDGIDSMYKAAGDTHRSLLSEGTQVVFNDPKIGSNIDLALDIAAVPKTLIHGSAKILLHQKVGFSDVLNFTTTGYGFGNAINEIENRKIDPDIYLASP